MTGRELLISLVLVGILSLVSRQQLYVNPRFHWRVVVQMPRLFIAISGIGCWRLIAFSSQNPQTLLGFIFLFLMKEPCFSQFERSITLSQIQAAEGSATRQIPAPQGSICSGWGQKRQWWEGWWISALSTRIVCRGYHPWGCFSH